MKAVIYARYSSDGQREESIEGQLRECKAFAEKNGMAILSTYIDRALSAKTDNRPEFQRMVKDSAEQLFDAVIVWKLDRFARNRYDSAHYKSTLRKNGVKVISATEAIAEDSTGILLESLLEGYAEFYSVELSEKVVRGLTENALKCKYNGGIIPMGYYIDNEQHFQIDTTAAPVVLEMFTLYDKGATMQELVNLLNERGLKNVRGGKFTLNIINKLLKNRRYMGEYRYRDIVHPDSIPAIVPKDLFERVQERMVKNKRAPAQRKAEDDYLLTAKMYCGKDGVFMVGESGTSKTKKKVHRYYKCVNAKKYKSCDKKAIKKDFIESEVIKKVMEMLDDNDVVEYIVNTALELQMRESSDLPLLKKQLDDTNRAINNLLNAIEQGILTSSTKQRLEELEESKSNIEISILKEQMEKPLLTKEQLTYWICRFRKTDITNAEQRQRLVDIFVNSVYIFDNHAVVAFNYRDGSKTISLSDVAKTSLGSDLSFLGLPHFFEVLQLQRLQHTRNHAYTILTRIHKTIQRLGLQRKPSTYTKWAVSFFERCENLAVSRAADMRLQNFLFAMLAARVSRLSETLDTTHRAQLKQVNRHSVAIDLNDYIHTLSLRKNMS
ncbi:MAG: recombinase family protein [Oscillospiraceae bacterium]|nr:recombinase family protein [Oscillospiraceae bacterium]